MAEVYLSEVVYPATSSVSEAEKSVSQLEYLPNRDNEDGSFGLECGETMRMEKNNEGPSRWPLLEESNVVRHSPSAACRDPEVVNSRCESMSKDEMSRALMPSRRVWKFVGPSIENIVRILLVLVRRAVLGRMST